MVKPQIIRFSEYLQSSPSEAVRTVVYQGGYDNMVLWQIPPQKGLPAHRHPQGVDIWMVLQGRAELVDDEMSGRTIHAGESVVIAEKSIHGARNTGSEDCILVSIVSPAAGFEAV